MFAFASATAGTGLESTVLPPVDASVLLTSIRERHQLPGLAAVVLQGAHIVAQGVVGVRKAGEETAMPITLHDAFHLGSATKAMTATLVAQLVEEGQLRWSMSLAEIFAPVLPHIDSAWQSVTLQHVLAHRAGLPADPGGLRRAWAFVSGTPLPEQRHNLVAAALSHPPATPPGAKFLYSNVGYILLGAIIEKITGQSWENVMRTRLFAPLGIGHGGFGPPGAPDRVEQPWGHTDAGKALSPDAHGADNPAFYGPAGTVHLPIAEWAKFVALHLQGDPANPHRHVALLTPETFAHLHTPAPEEDYLAGWMFARRVWARGARSTDGGHAFWHNGTNKAWFSLTWLAPEIDFAVLIACNQGGEAATVACDEAAGVLIQEFSRASG